MELAIAHNARPQILELLSKDVSTSLITQAIDKGSMVGETVQECILRLGVPNWMKLISNDHRISLPSCDQTRRVKKRIDHKLRYRPGEHPSPDTTVEAIVDDVKSCRSLFKLHSADIRQMAASITELLQTVSAVLAECVEQRG